MAKAKKVDVKKSDDAIFYTRLLVSRRRQVTLAAIMLVYFILFAVLLFQNMSNDVSWVMMAVPIVLAGSLFIFFPATEEWEYRPWQNKQQKQERLFFN